MYSPALIFPLVATLCAAQGGEFIMEARRRTVASNLVQLTCITDASRGTASRDALFFLNGTVLGEVGIRMIMSEDGVLIMITRDTEGIYSCALPFDPRTSNTVTLVGEKEVMGMCMNYTWSSLWEEVCSA